MVLTRVHSLSMISMQNPLMKLIFRNIGPLVFRLPSVLRESLRYFLTLICETFWIFRIDIDKVSGT